METPREYHYVYYSYEEYGRGYIGSRSCKCLPEEDIKYFGSFKDKSFKPSLKIILKCDYATREEAYADEIILQEYYKVVENPHFANRAYQTSTGFSTKGVKHTDLHKQFLSSKLKGKNPHLNKIHPFKGKKHTEEWKKIQSQRMINNNPMKRNEISIKQSNSMRGRSPWNKGIKYEKYNNGGNPNSKKIIFKKRIYSSIKEAMEENQISYYLVKKNCTYIDK